MELKTFFAQDSYGNIVANPVVTVFLKDSTELASGLEDQSSDALTNPFTGSINGKIEFYAPDGEYDIQVVGSGRTMTLRVIFFDAQTQSDTSNSRILVIEKRTALTPVVNIDGLERWYKALAVAERVPAYILATGNSTLDGVSTDGTTAPPDVEMDKYSYIGQLRSKFARYYGTPDQGSIPAKDSRTVMSGTASSLSSGTSTAGPGGNLFRIMPSGSVATVAVPRCTEIRIDYFSGITAYGSFEYTVDGGSPVAVPIDNSGVTQYKEIVIPGLSDAPHTIVITSTASSVYFGGVRYHSGRGVVVSKYARSSWGMYDWFGKGNNNTGASAGGTDRAQKGARMGNPNLFVLSFIRNDMKGRLTKPLNIQGVPANGGYDMWADYEIIYNHVVAGGGCMLIIGEPADKYYPALEGLTISDLPTMTDVERFHRDFAHAHAHCAYVNLPDLFGYWDEASARGFYRNIDDQIHYGPTGLGATGDALFEILKPRTVFADEI